MLIQFARLVLTAAGTQNIVPDTSGQKIVVYHIGFDISAATALPDFRSHTTGTVHAGPFDSAGPHYFHSARDLPLFETDPNKGLDMVTAGVGNVRGFIVYEVRPI